MLAETLSTWAGGMGGPAVQCAPALGLGAVVAGYAQSVLVGCVSFSAGCGAWDCCVGRSAWASTGGLFPLPVLLLKWRGPAERWRTPLPLPLPLPLTGMTGALPAQCAAPVLPLMQEVCAALGAPDVAPESHWWVVSNDGEALLGYTGQSSKRDIAAPNFITGGKLDPPAADFRQSINNTYQAEMPGEGAREIVSGGSLLCLLPGWRGEPSCGADAQEGAGLAGAHAEWRGT